MREGVAAIQRRSDLVGKLNAGEIQSTTNVG